MREFYERVVKPMMLPMTAGIFIFVAVWSFSRILLAVPEIGSTSLALLVAAEILGVSAVIAAAAKLKAAQKAITVVLGLALVGGGGAAAAIGEREIAPHGGEAEFALTAQGILFTATEITVPADEPFELSFENLDPGTPHNVAVYTDETAAESLFIGEIFNGVATEVYEVPALAAGTYFFRCDVHPDPMTGTMTAGEGGPGPGPTGEPTDTASPAPTDTASPGATTFDISAQNIQFDTDTMVLAADTAVTINFANNDVGVQHNVAIYTDESRTQAIFQGEIFNGPDSQSYSVPATPAGEYAFFCDVHPNMKGTAIFR